MRKKYKSIESIESIEKKVKSLPETLMNMRIKFLEDIKAERVEETPSNGAQGQKPPAPGISGIDYRPFHISAVQMGSDLTHNKHERILLSQNTALAILQVAGVEKAALSQATKELAAAQMKKNEGRSDKEEGPTIPEILIKYLPEVGGKKLISKQAKKLIKRAEGAMMTRLANEARLYERTDQDSQFKMTVDRVAINENGTIQNASIQANGKKDLVITRSALLKGKLAEGQPPRNLRMLTCQGPLGTKNYFISSYVVAGTDVTGLKARAGDDKVFYSSVVDGKDHFGSRLIDVFKRITGGDSELKLQKEAAKSDEGKIIRMNTTQKPSFFTANSMSSQVGILLAIAIVAGTGFGVPFILAGLAAGIGVGIAAVVGGVIVGSLGASLKVNPAIYDEADKAIIKLGKIQSADDFNKAYGANATKENLDTLKESKKVELTYLKDQLKKVEQGKIKPGNRWKPVFEQMIVARTGGVALMGCKSGKDRAFGITALIMAMEQRVESCVEQGVLKRDTLDTIDLAKDKVLASNLKNIYMDPYGSRVGAENCDGAFGTKTPQDFFPKGLWNALSPEDQKALKEFCKTSHSNAKLNDGVKYTEGLTNQPLAGKEGGLQSTELLGTSGLSDKESVVKAQVTDLRAQADKGLGQAQASQSTPDAEDSEARRQSPK